MKDATRLLTSANLKDELPKDILAELRHLTRALDELLYHFWSCVPFSNAAQEKKFVEMKETLDRFEYTKVQPLHERLSREFHRDVSDDDDDDDVKMLDFLIYFHSQLTSHLKSKLHAAEVRFNSWNTKKQFQSR